LQKGMGVEAGCKEAGDLRQVQRSRSVHGRVVRGRLHRGRDVEAWCKEAGVLRQVSKDAETGCKEAGVLRQVQRDRGVGTGAERQGC
jgi:hypothetical protein